jgi:hypothetical protein
MHEIVCHISKAIWLVAIVALINMGLMPFGYNMFQTELFETSLAWAVNPIHYIAGIAGLLGVYKLIMKMQGKSGMCSMCPCGRGECK